MRPVPRIPPLSFHLHHSKLPKKTLPKNARILAQVHDCVYDKPVRLHNVKDPVRKAPQNESAIALKVQRCDQREILQHTKSCVEMLCESISQAFFSIFVTYVGALNVQLRSQQKLQPHADFDFRP